MKRAQTPEPAGIAIPFDAVAGRVRARETFSCDGVTFRKDAFYDGYSELVQLILREYPGVFEPANLWK